MITQRATLRGALAIGRKLGLEVKDQPDCGDVRVTLSPQDIRRLAGYATASLMRVKARAESLAMYPPRTDPAEVLWAVTTLAAWRDRAREVTVGPMAGAQ